MTIRALLLSSLRIAAFGAVGGLAACGGSQGKLPVDTPVLSYKQPDIDDITGIDDTDSDSDDSDADSGSASATVPGSPATAGSAAAGSAAGAVKPGK